MSFHKLFELSQKLRVKTAEFNQEKELNDQLLKLSVVRDEVNKDFTRILNQMEGDLLTLKIKGFSKLELKEFVKIFYELVSLRKRIASFAVYDGIQQIVDLINSKEFQAQISTLNLSIQHFLEENQIYLDAPNKLLQQASVKSLSQLSSFADKWQTYVINNPLADYGKPQPQPQFGLSVIPDPEYKSSGPEDKTVNY